MPHSTRMLAVPKTKSAATRFATATKHAHDLDSTETDRSRPPSPQRRCNPDRRDSTNGSCKLGAFIGVFRVPQLQKNIGLRGMLTVAGVAAVLGLLLTRSFPSRPKEPQKTSRVRTTGTSWSSRSSRPQNYQKRQKCQRFLTPSPRSSEPLSPRTVDSDHKETLGAEAVPAPNPTKGRQLQSKRNGTVIGRAVHDYQTHGAEGSICVREPFPQQSPLNRQIDQMATCAGADGSVP